MWFFRLDGRYQIAVASAAAFVCLLLWTVISQQGIERQARKAAVGACVAKGEQSAPDCQKRISGNSARCFMLTFTPASTRAGRPESFDEGSYRACAESASADAWSLERGKEVQAMKRREADQRKEQLQP